MIYLTVGAVKNRMKTDPFRNMIVSNALYPAGKQYSVTSLKEFGNSVLRVYISLLVILEICLSVSNCCADRGSVG